MEEEERSDQEQRLLQTELENVPIKSLPVPLALGTLQSV